MSLSPRSGRNERSEWRTGRRPVDWRGAQPLYVSTSDVNIPADATIAARQLSGLPGSPRHNAEQQRPTAKKPKAPVSAGKRRLRWRLCRGQRARHAWKRKGAGTREAHGGLTRVSSGSKGSQSKRHASMGGGSPRSTREAGQRPRRKGGEQGKLFGEGPTAAPEAGLPASPKLAELVARARKEGRLTNVVQFVDEGTVQVKETESVSDPQGDELTRSCEWKWSRSGCC